MKLNLQFQSEKLQKLQEKEAEKKENFRSIADKVYELQEKSKPKSEQTTKMEDGGKYSEDSKERLKEFYRQAKAAGYSGDINLDSEDLGAEAGKLQEWMVKNKPELVVDYFTKSGQPITSKGIDMLKKSNPEIFNKVGLDPNKPSAEYSPEERKKFTGALVQSGVGSEFWLEQFNDNRWDYRAPQISNSVEGEDRIIEDGLEAPLLTDYSNPTDKPSGASNTQNSGFSGTEESDKTSREEGLRSPNLPDQSVLPPNAMAGHLKNNYRFNRVEPGKVSPEQALAEIGSQLETGVDQANQRPDSMRAALLAQMLAGSQKQGNQAVTAANTANQQSVNQAENYNAQVGDREMSANNQENLRFEQMQMRAKENTDMDFRDYLDYNRKVRLNNYNTVNQMNMMNDLFDKFEVVDGEVRQKSGTDFFASGNDSKKKTKKA